MKDYSITKRIGLFIGPLVFCLVTFSPFTFISPEADSVIALALWMVIWWITEAVSISVTALLPILILPLTHILSIKEVTQNYGSPIIFLFFGGFVMALALEKVHLHKRIALTIIKLTGTSPNRVILGFMIATAFMSMWISNTASTVVMLPIALSVIKLLINDEDGFSKNDRNFALSIMLGIAFAANIGGVSTIIGTPPNSVLVGFLENEYQIEISFLKWMVLGVPFSIIMLAIMYWVIVKWFYPNRLETFMSDSNIIDQELAKLGPTTAKEKRVLIVFGVTIFLWISRTYLNSMLPGIQLNDTIISVAGALALFTIPMKLSKDSAILNWDDTQKLPWGILLLFGGGLALAKALSHVGLIEIIANAIAQNKELSIFLVAILLITIMLFMTELMSNVALVTIFVPVVAGIAIGLEIPILHILIPVTIASSCAFMLPMATPPNAIVFASGYVKVSEMARVGVILNTIAILLLIVLFQFVIPYVF